MFQVSKHDCLKNLFQKLLYLIRGGFASISISFLFFCKSSTRLYKSNGICKLYKLSSGTTKHNVPRPIKESPQWIHSSPHWMWAVIRLTDMFDFLLWVTSDPLGISMLIACKLHKSWHTFDRNMSETVLWWCTEHLSQHQIRAMQYVSDDE